MLSGFAGLGYEIVWTRMLALQLGHEIVATLSVITAFFAGLLLGSLVLGMRAARSARPWRWYAGLELAIGAWAVALTVLLPATGRLMPALLGTDPAPLLQWSVTFAVPLLVLLPATAAMGGTLPALVAMLPAREGRGAVGTAYAANTAGAVLGTLLATFVIAPALGFTGTLLLLAAANGACAVAALWLAPGRVGVMPALAEPMAPPDLLPNVLPDRRRLAALLASGLLGIGYEVLAVRVLSQLLENTVYTFASLLSAYLLGTAAGGALARRLAPATASDAGAILDRLLAATACACLLGTLALFQADALAAGFRAWLPRSEAGGIALELLLGACALLLPAVGMGAVFTHLGQHSVRRPGGLGRAAGVNLLGAALAPVLFGVLVLPLAGAKAGLAGVALGYAALMRPRGRRGWALASVPAVAALALLLAPVPLSFVRVPPGGALVAEVEGVTASVAVVQDRAGDHLLQVNGHFRQGGTATTRSDRRLAYLPLLLHPDPRRALFLGLGTGVTLAAAAEQPGLVADGVELVPEILPLLPLFSRAAGDLAARPNVHLHVADARRWVRADPGRYDVVMADLYFPAVDGAGALYTREHFEAIRDRLAPSGVFCQWLPLHQLDLDTLRLIARTFLVAFPDGSAWLANFSTETPLVALVGTASPVRYPPGWFDLRARDPAFRERLRANGLAGDLGLFGLFLAGADGLGRFAGPGPLNTDDRPLVTFRAPAAAYATAEPPGERVARLVGLLDPHPGDVLRAEDPAESARLAGYWRARDGFLRLGAAEAPGVGRAAGPAATVARLAPALLGLVRASPDFDPAYDPLLAMAQALHRTDPAGAAALLRDLDAAAPARPGARRLLGQLSAAPAR